MSSSRALWRLELALGGLGVTASSLAFLIALDAIQFHLVALWRCACHFAASDMPIEGWLLAALALLDGVVFVRAVRSVMRQLTAHRRLLRALPVCRDLLLGGEVVRVVPAAGLHAFCAGLVRPAVYVSEGLLRDTAPAELRAIVAHEAHHRTRRDPLRQLLARVVSDAFRPLPALTTLADRQTALADLAADAAAVRALGDVQPLAAALVRFDELAASTGHGVAPERVDHLVRQGPPATVSPWLLVAAGCALGGIMALALPMLLLGWHPAPAVPVALEVAAVVAASMPAYVAARRAGECLQPAA